MPAEAFDRLTVAGDRCIVQHQQRRACARGLPGQPPLILVLEVAGAGRGTGDEVVQAVEVAAEVSGDLAQRAEANDPEQARQVNEGLRLLR